MEQSRDVPLALLQPIPVPVPAPVEKGRDDTGRYFFVTLFRHACSPFADVTTQDDHQN